MVLDSIANASISTVAAAAKDFSKKKKANKSARLKQSKLDARREQWLSHVRGRGCEENPKILSPESHEGTESGSSVVKFEIDARVEEIEGLVDNDIEVESPTYGPTTSHRSSLLGSDGSGINFTDSSGSSGSNGDCFSGSTSEEDEEDDGCLDDWEALADALPSNDSKNEIHNPNVNVHEDENMNELNSSPAPDIERGKSVPMASDNYRAWRPDDAFRPQSFPNLLKQLSFPTNSERHYEHGRSLSICKKVGPAPSCPICCEDLDFTDSNFLPCSCGFRLCLFCHKRILEENGRCPGCRKQYEQGL